MSQATGKPTGRHIGQIFFQRASELGSRTFVKLQKGDRFEEISWQEFAALVQKVALGLIALGLSPGDTIAIIGENSLEWLAADLATLSVGFTNVVISPALSDAMCLKVLGHAGCRAAFVQDTAGVGRVLNLKGQLPGLSHIIAMDGTDADLPSTLSFSELVERGCQVNASRFTSLVEAVHPSDLATIMYTSGSTGEPKGVMRTQGNLLANITNGGAIVVSGAEDLAVNILSLNHLFGRFGFLKSAVTGRTTALIDALETKVNLGVIAQLAPTGLAVVPRVMEGIWRSLLMLDSNQHLWADLENLDGKKSSLGLDDSEARRFDELRANLRVSTRQSLGGRIKYVAYGGAAMAPRIMRFFELVGIPLIGSYGSTECGGVTLCGIGENRPGNLGKPFANVEVRIAEDGEILVRGPTVSPGYYQNPQATGEAFDDEGWFYTGDLGVLESDGSLRVTGRKKDVFNCSEGSNIYPGFIELRLENETFIRQAVLLGDQRPFIAALVVADLPRIAAALERDIANLTDDQIEGALWSQIAHVNAGLESHERIRKIIVLGDEFPAEVRAVNVFQKIKVDRKVVAERYQNEIETIYASAPEGDGH
jgi:long-chain acyl-CoA synthetase